MIESTKEMMDFLVDHRAPDLPPKGLAEVFDRLVWCLADNGTALDQVIRAWLRGSDKVRVEIALAREETFPADSRDEMEIIFQRITRQWPDLTERCESILKLWDEQFPQSLAVQQNGAPH